MSTCAAPHSPHVLDRQPHGTRLAGNASSASSEKAPVRYFDHGKWLVLAGSDWTGVDRFGLFPASTLHLQRT